MTNNHLMELISFYFVIILIIITSPIIICIYNYKLSPVMVSFVFLVLFIAMRLIRFMNAMESVLVFVILSVLFGLVTASVNSIKRNALKKSKLLNYIHQ